MDQILRDGGAGRDSRQEVQARSAPEGESLSEIHEEGANEGKETPATGPSADLSAFLHAWDYDASSTVRRLRAEDGREVIQVRLPLGIEQYEIDGRPDGKRPMRRESWLHHYTAKIRTLAKKSDRFAPSEKDFRRLQEEGVLYYHRYLLFFQMQEYRLCARDTLRNTRLLDFVRKYFRKEFSDELEQYRPYVLRMHAMARALYKIEADEDVRGAIRLLRRAVADVEALPPLEGSHVFEWEKTRSLKSLEDLLGQLESQVPPSRRAILERRLQMAVREEDYERAARLRDEIALLSRKNKETAGP
jgi:hypothetical protein